MLPVDIDSATLGDATLFSKQFTTKINYLYFKIKKFMEHTINLGLLNPKTWEFGISQTITSSELDNMTTEDLYTILLEALENFEKINNVEVKTELAQELKRFAEYSAAKANEPEGLNRVLNIIRETIEGATPNLLGYPSNPSSNPYAVPALSNKHAAEMSKTLNDYLENNQDAILENNQDAINDIPDSNNINIPDLKNLRKEFIDTVNKINSAYQDAMNDMNETYDAPDGLPHPLPDGFCLNNPKYACNVRGGNQDAIDNIPGISLPDINIPEALDQIIEKIHIVSDFINDSKIYKTITGIDPDFLPKLGIFVRDHGIDTAINFADKYWQEIRYYGFNLQLIDNIILFLIASRLIILWLRYNLVTSLAITGISTLTGYVWYCTFLNAINNYEDLLYINTWTFRLGVDATQIRSIMAGQVANSEYGLRITNPLGILLAALEAGSIRDQHHIDPISLIMVKIPHTINRIDVDKFIDRLTLLPAFIREFIRRLDLVDVYERGRHGFEGTYYYVYHELIPLAIRTFTGFVEQFRSYMIYAYLTRVNRKFCPYLLRWHWTFIMLMKFMEPFLLYVLYRLIDYQESIIQPKIEYLRSLNLSVSYKMFELQIFYSFGFSIIIGHLAFILFGMFHALIGQYFYIPFMTENVELHVGPRDTSSIYSGGYTAWQDKKEKWTGPIPKLWYGWFGRGARTLPLPFVFLRGVIFDPIYLIVSIVLSILKRIWRFIFKRRIF